MRFVHTPRRDAILQPDMIAWLGRMLDGLLARDFELTYLARHFNDVVDASADRLDGLLRAQRREAFQHALITPAERPRLDARFTFRFEPQQYPARWHYNGRYEFRKHFYPKPSELKSEIDGEETACAIALDRLPQVRHWVRNLERQPEYAFWLPTSTDRFYPDFIAELNDGRLLVIEYKGAHLYDNADSREKRVIGEVWAEASDGRCVFLMVSDANKMGVEVATQMQRVL